VGGVRHFTDSLLSIFHPPNLAASMDRMKRNTLLIESKIKRASCSPTGFVVRKGLVVPVKFIENANGCSS
jgi:hypothetical protein